MSKRPVCRACLVDNLTMYRVTNSPYEEIYEKLSNAKVDKGNLPETFCYICMTMLRKFQKFAALTQESNIMLEQWYRNEIDCKPKKRPQFKISTTTVEYITSKIPDPDLTKEVKVKIEPDDTEAMNQVQFIELTNESDPYGEETTDVNMDASNFKGSDSWSDAEQKPGPASDEEFEVPIVKQEPRKRAVKAEKTPKGVPANKEFKQNPIESEKHLAVTTAEQKNQRRKNANKKSQKKILTCNVCKKQFKSRNGLRLHERCHNEAFWLQCDYCNQKFVNRYSLKRHNRDEHSDKIPIFCNICNFEGSNENDLFSHKLNNHAFYKQLICDICGFKTKVKHTIESHIKRKHVGDKSVSCDICDYRCVEKAALNRHRKSVHSKEEKYLCHICYYRCSFSDKLKRHLEVHKNVNEKNYKYSCSVCGHKFLRKETLTIHFRIHTGEKPYSCTICNRKFTQRCTLKTHSKRVHNEDKIKQRNET